MHVERDRGRESEVDAGFLTIVNWCKRGKRSFDLPTRVHVISRVTRFLLYSIQTLELPKW